MVACRRVADSLIPNHLQWPTARAERTMRVCVVEPRVYDPSTHTSLFQAAVNRLVDPEPERIDGSTEPGAPLPERRHLITFPEAFVPCEALLQFLRSQVPAALGAMVHAGIRPDNSDTHLFTWQQASGLAATLSEISPRDDDAFSKWLAGVPREAKLNLAVVVATDPDTDQVQVCVFPKCVRSKYQHKALPDEHMHEGSMLTLVTLHASTARVTAPTVQPVICSDVLAQATDRGTPDPLRTLSGDRCTIDPPPQSVDIVSVAACTPTIDGGKGLPRRRWKQPFREVFADAVRKDDYQRHRQGAFVLSNFGRGPKEFSGGLSGVCLPLAASGGYPQSLHTDWYGRADDDSDNGWSLAKAPEQTVAHLVAMSPASEDVEVSLFYFTLPRLPRDLPRVTSGMSLVDCRIEDGRISAGQPQWSRRNLS